jgi:S-adenosyl methyltransferase
MTTPSSMRPADDISGGDLPARFDPGVAHPARVYGYWLGGKDHYPADRAAAQEVARLRPQVIAAARANRGFGCRVTGWAAAGLGIRQFLDIGAGLPAPGPTHEVAQRISPDCRVVYADNDPLVIAHGRAFMRARPGAAPCGYVFGDLRVPEALLERAGELLDFTQPVAVLLLAVLHFVADEENPAGIVAALAAALAPGSIIAISHLTADFAPDEIAASAAAYNARVPVHAHPRSRDQITALSGPLPVAHPGVVPINHWLPSLRETPGPAVDLHAAVLRLPRRDGTGLTARAEREVADLAQAAAQFPGHDITHEHTGAGRAYVAKARDLSTSPYLVMTSTLDQLRARLGPS